MMSVQAKGIKFKSLECPCCQGRQDHDFARGICTVIDSIEGDLTALIHLIRPKLLAVQFHLKENQEFHSRTQEERQRVPGKRWPLLNVSSHPNTFHAVNKLLNIFLKLLKPRDQLPKANP
jgi:hypothetical protein